MAERITGAEAMMKALEHEGVDVLFGYPGGSIMPTYDALYDYKDKLNHILVRHEQGAVHAAQGYARVSGKVGCAIVTSGPGATNTVTGIADAMIDSTPMVVICGQVGVAMLGTDAFQEVDVVGVTSPCRRCGMGRFTCLLYCPQRSPRSRCARLRQKCTDWHGGLRARNSRLHPQL